MRRWERKRLERMGLSLETCVMSLFIHVFSSGTVFLCGAKAHQITLNGITLGYTSSLRIMCTFVFLCYCVENLH